MTFDDIRLVKEELQRLACTTLKRPRAASSVLAPNKKQKKLVSLCPLLPKRLDQPRFKEVIEDEASDIQGSDEESIRPEEGPVQRLRGCSHEGENIGMVSNLERSSNLPNI